MATRRTSPPPDADDGDELTPTSPGTGLVLDSRPMYEDDDPLARIRAEISSLGDTTFKVKIYRIVGGEREYLEDTTFAEWEENGIQELQRKYGAGRYSLMVYGPAGLIGRPTFRVGAAMNQPTVTAPAPAPAVPHELQSILAGMVEMQRATLDTLQRMTATPPAPPADPMQRVREMAEIVTLARSLNPPAPPVAPPVDPMAMLNQVMGLVRGVREMREEIEPEPPADNPLALLGKGIDVIGKIVTANAGANTGANGAGAVGPAVTLPPSFDESATGDDSPGAELEPEQTDNMNPMQLLILRGHLLQLIQMQVAGDSAEKAAEFLLSKLPDEFTEYLRLPTWFEILAQFAPAVSAHRQWLTDVRAAALAKLN